MKTIMRSLAIAAFMGLLLSFTTPSTDVLTTVYKDYDLILWTPVYCEGIMVDFLTGSIKAHAIEQIRDGKYLWIARFVGEVESQITHEIFRIMEVDKYEWTPEEETWTYHFNFIGNEGTHYINSGYLDFSTGECVPLHSICVENGK